MQLNLLVHLDNFRWTNITIDRSSELMLLAETIETLGDCKDRVWQHPDSFTLCYNWGCLHELFEKDLREIKAITGWMEQIHFKTLLRFWRNVAFNQKEPLSYNLADLQQSNPELLNGMVGYENNIGIVDFVYSPQSRYEFVINYCTSNNDLINWNKVESFFLPNIAYSNQFLAEQRNKLNNDLRERKSEIPVLAKAYCDKDYKRDVADSGKEGTANRVGTEVARRNFYKHEPALSTLEQQLRKSLRKIFSIRKDDENLYLSIDFEKANCFELCNNNGEHIGEFRFDGLQNSKRDATGKHDIYALRK